MSWHGIGFISQSSRNFAGGDALSDVPPSLKPAASWTGLAGSGFAAIPTDPARTTAKPALRLITPPFQWFTNALDVGVMAAANDDGSLFNTLGIADVKFHYEGNVVTVAEPSWHAVQTQRGVRVYFGWWVRLMKPSGTAGHGHLYVEATARDATMQKRVIGPYTFSPQNVQYDAELTVAPSLSVVTGLRYKTLAAATAWCKANGRRNPLITITEAGLYAPGSATPETYTSPGYYNITASVPGATIGRPQSAWALNGNNDLGNDQTKLHLFGPNITLDYRYVGALQLASATPSAVAEFSHWLDGITMTNSDPAGLQTHWGGVPRDGNAITVIGQPWFTEVAVSNMAQPMIAAALVRGCTGKDLFADMVNGARLVLQSAFNGNDNNFWSDDRPAFSVEYAGAAATATIARSGGVRGTGGGGVWTVTLGASVNTFSTGSSPFFNTGSGRYFADLVAWLNTLPDVTATLLISPFDRVASSGSLPGRAGQGFAGTNIKGSPLTVVSNFDVHADWYQHGSGANLDNVIVAFNAVLEAQAQIVFLSPPNPAPRSERDVLFFGNIFHAGRGDFFDPDISASQWGRPSLPLPASHVVIAHNTFVNQRFLIRNESGGLSADGYCLMKNNTMPSLTINGTAPVPNLTVDGEHLQVGAAPPTGATNVTIGGVPSSLFVDAEAYNFAPAGELLASLKTPGLGLDMNRAPFPPLSSAGALAR